MRRTRLTRLWAAALVPLAGVLLAPACGGLGGENAVTTVPTAANNSFADEVARVRGGVIRIEAKTCDGISVGTGVLIKPSLVATVQHVIDGAAKITLKRDGKVLSTATVIGVDRDRDLALLKASAPISGYTFGFASTAPKLGEEVGALGFPLGLPLTVTRGSVSGFGRSISIDGIKRRHLVQTDAAVNHGNSGGPLISVSTGEVVGLVDLGSTEASGVAFAVSASVAAPLLKAWAAAPQPSAQSICDNVDGRPGGGGTVAVGAISPGDYADAIDTALIDSARTRGDLGDLITWVNDGSYDYASAVAAIEAIIDQRRTLLADVQAVEAPGAFGRSAQLLKASLAAAISDDLAVEDWIKAKLRGDTSTANSYWRRNVQLSQRATAAKTQFLKTYNAVRRRLIGLTPLDVAY